MEHFSPIKSVLFNTQSQAKSPVFTTLSPNLNLPIDNSFLQDGRESLGILHPGFEKDLNLSFTDRDLLSVKNVLCLEDSDVGRESLGILQINNLNINFGNEDEKVPDIMLSFVENVNSSNKILDTGFLISSPSRRLLSTTSQMSGLSFNSNSLEYPSKIFTLTKTEQTNSNSLISPSHSLLNNARIMINSDLDSRNRINSQPPLTSSNPIEAGQFFWSTGRPAKMKMFSTNIHPEKLAFSDDKDDMFHDSVFIEGNHIAQKIADGSFLNECFENGPLDSTPQPEWPDLDESIKSKESDSKTSTDSVFKTVDKLLPNLISNKELNKRNSKSSSDSSKSRDAKDILQNLSDIFNTTHKSEKQKSEGLLLLKNLAEMLNNSQTSQDNDLEDSGHSSITHNDIEKDKNIVDELVNMDKKESDSLNKVNTSITSEIGDSNLNKLSQSLCANKKLPKKIEKRHSSTSSMDTHFNKNITSNNSSVKSNDSNSSTFAVKSKVGTAGPKKGPLRAVIPIKEMKKGPSTPEKTEQKTKLQSKKTSTPINEPKLKPVAASTPTLDNEKDISSKGSPKWGSRNSVFNRSNSLTETSNKEKLKKDPNGTPTTSKLRRPSFGTSSYSKEKLNTSPIPTRLQERKVVRRNSVTEGIIGSQFRKRSNSLGKETGMMSSLRKVRENILKSPYYNQKTGILVDSNSKGELNVEKKVTFKNLLDTSVKLKKTDKENIFK